MPEERLLQRVSKLEEGNPPWLKLGTPTVLFDAASQPTAGTGTLSWTHTPVDTPTGVLVLIAQGDNTSDDTVTAVTYGGVTMHEIPQSPVIHATGSEDGVLYGYFLAGREIPTGAQTVSVTVTGTREKQACAFSLVGANTDMLYLAGVAALDSGGVANPSVSVPTPSACETFVAGVLHSGHDAASSVTAGSSFTEVHEHDFSADVCSFIRRTSNSTGGATTVDWTATSEEAGILAVAIRAEPPRDFGIVRALPTNAGIGDRCSYQFETTTNAPNGLWELVYDGVGIHPWKCVGGAPMYAEDNDARSTTSATYVDVPTDPMSITVPLAGDYLITIQSTAAAIVDSVNVYHSYAVGGTAASDAWAIRNFATGASIIEAAASKTTKHSTVSASAVIAEKIRSATGGSTVQVDDRRLIVLPLKVG